MIDLREALAAAERTLAAAGVTGPDASILAAHVLDLPLGTARARAATGHQLDARQSARLEALVARRARREPLQHLTGIAPFRHLELHVGPGVFVPRPETEVLVDRVLALLGDARPGTVVDAGTGSGAIAIAVATERPGTRVIAIERSPAAFAYAKRNLDALAPDVHLLHGDFGAPIERLEGAVDVLVSNPPYVPDGAIPRDPEVRLHDPRLALYGGSDGLDAVRSLAARGTTLVRAGGWIALEHGELQGEAVRALLAQRGWRDAATTHDLTGRDRVTVAQRPPSASPQH